MNQESKEILRAKVNSLRAMGNPRQTRLSPKQKNSQGESSTATRKENYKWAQDFVNVNQIKYGLVFCKDRRIIKILEVLPLNYYQRSNFEKNFITENYANFFRACPPNIHFKTCSEKINIATLINIIHKAF